MKFRNRTLIQGTKPRTSLTDLDRSALLRLDNADLKLVAGGGHMTYARAKEIPFDPSDPEKGGYCTVDGDPNTCS